MFTKGELQDTAFFIAFWDCYLKWLSSQEETSFVILTWAFKIHFINSGSEAGKRYALVSTPTKELIQALNESGAEFTEMGKKETTPDEIESDPDSDDSTNQRLLDQFMAEQEQS